MANTCGHTHLAERAFTLVETMVSLFLGSVVMIAVVQSFAQLSQTSHNQKLRTVAQMQAQFVIDMMVPELRMLGNGLPFHQSNFLIAQETLADNVVTQPILVAGTTANQIQFRLNQTGETYILTQDFHPASETSVTLTGIDKIFIGDEIYITNSTVGADDGFWGVVSGLNSATKAVTFSSTDYSPGATFAKGSLFEVVPIITYTSADNFGGITRDDGNGPVGLVQHAEFSLEFLDSAGDALTLPLEASSADPFPASAIQNVRSIRVTVQVQSSSPLTDGNTYTATAMESVGVRNLNYKY